MYTLRHKLRQSLYKPQKSRFFTKKSMKELDDLEKTLEKTFGKKKKKSGKADEKKDAKAEK